MLTAGPLGINLSTSLNFVDLMKEAPDWGPAFTEPLTENAQGWPTSDASIVVLDERVNQPWNGPDANAVPPDIGGTYHLSFQGQADVVAGGATTQNQVYNVATNTTMADVVVPHNGFPFLQLSFYYTVNPASATGAGVTDVKLIQPGYAANTTQLFTTNFENALQPFGTLRYLNVDGANNYAPTQGPNNQLAVLNWSQRTLPSARSQASPTNATPGEAWEYMIALANATNTDMWIDIPASATDDYVTQLAKLIQNGDTVNGVTYAGLNANLKVYLEYSNEVWGGTYNPYAYNLMATQQELAAGGSKLNSDGNNDLYTDAGRRYLERTMQITTDFRNVLGADPSDSKIRPVLGWQETNWQFYNTVFPWFESNYGAPSNFFYGMGNANYWGSSDYSSVDAIINSLAASEAQTYATTADFTTIATFYGLKNVAYEGGPGITDNGNPAYAANALAASRDPRMESLVKQHYLDWFAAGGDVANFFDGPFEAYSPQYIFGAAEPYQIANPSLSAKYRGLADIAAAPSQPVTFAPSISATTTLSLPLSTDSLGDMPFSLPFSGQTNEWTVNATTAGTYKLTLTTNPSRDSWAQQGGLVQVLTTDQQVVGSFAVTAQGGTFSLGSFSLPAGLTTLTIRTIHGINDPLGVYEFFPTSLVLAGTPAVAPSVQTIDDSSTTGFTSTGYYQYNGAGFDNQLHAAAAGSTTAEATYTFNVAPGTYSIASTWIPASFFANAVNYSVLGGSSVIGSATVNQQSSPTSFNDQGSAWQTLGSFTDTGTTLTVSVAGLASGWVEADALRVQQVSGNTTPPPPPPTPQYLDDSSASGFSATVGFSQFNGAGINNEIRATGPGSTATATYTFTVAPGTYSVAASWVPASIFSPDVNYSILGGSSVIGSATVDQQLSPTSFNDQNSFWQTLGSFTVTGTTLTITVSGMADGWVEADGLRILQAATSTTPPPPPAPLQYLDDSSTTGFSANSGFGQFSGAGINNEIRATGPGDLSAQATYTFTVAPGTYSVAASWAPASIFSPDVNYSILGGSSVIGSATVNQQLSPASFADQGALWQTLGSFTVTGTTLTITVGGMADGWVEADGMRIIKTS